MIQRKDFFRIPAVAGICVMVLFSGCGKNPDAGKDKKTPALPVVVIGATDATVSTEYSATLEGKVNVEIRPQVDGTLQKILVDEGDFVNAGQPLFKIDDAVYQEAYNTALAAQHAAEASAAVSKLDVEKLVPLVKNKVVSEIQMKTAKANNDAAKARAEQARAAARSARVTLDYTLIKAPVSGYIGRIPYRLGSLVSKNQTQQLTSLSDVRGIYAYFSMSEVEFTRFKQQFAGSSIQDKLKNVPPVSLLLADGSQFQKQGKLEAVSGQFDRSTGSISLRAVFPNEDGLLRTGNTGRVRIETVFRNALLVPQASTVELQDKVLVFILTKGNVVRRQAVTVAGKSGTSFIVSGGLLPGSTIVLTGVDKLQDGMVIKPVAEGAAKPAVKP